jgi:hypothetical protein
MAMSKKTMRPAIRKIRAKGTPAVMPEYRPNQKPGQPKPAPMPTMQPNYGKPRITERPRPGSPKKTPSPKLEIAPKPKRATRVKGRPLIKIIKKGI